MAGHSAAETGAPSASSFGKLALGSIGVVYGDIGTSPLYALREGLRAAGRDGLEQSEVIGIVSLLLWTLILIVTLKYVILILRADNNGEGGTLSLFALAQRAIGKRTRPLFILAVTGAALFYGDAAITPAISVLSAVEGLELIQPALETYVLPLTVVILTLLFWIQSRGTAKISVFFGPITVVWFLVMAALGIVHIGDRPQIFSAFNPAQAIGFLYSHGFGSLAVMGSVFLAVTGAEALYADMGHFGRGPIRAAWFGLVFPALALNYLGQGSLVLANPAAASDPFFLLAPEWGLVPLVLLATCATVIASQAVISGTFSLTQQAVQLGLLPRLEILHTSESLMGQIYMPRVNWTLMVVVLGLVLAFESSSGLASAYGIAVTGAMVIDSLLGFVVFRHLWHWPLAVALGVVAPLALIELTFFGANLAKLVDGGYVPVLIAGIIGVLMWTWVRGTAIVQAKARAGSVPLEFSDRDAAQVPAGPGAGHRGLSHVRPGDRAVGAAAQPQAQQRPARPQRRGDGDGRHHPARARARPRRRRGARRQLLAGAADLRLHGAAARATRPDAHRAPRGPELRDDEHVVFPQPALVPGIGHVGHAALAGQALHRHDQGGRRRHGLLPPAVQPRAGTRAATRRLRALVAPLGESVRMSDLTVSTSGNWG